MSTVSLSLARKVGFGLGCFFNNLTSTVWFTYLLLYYQEVSKLTAGQALTLSARLILLFIFPVSNYENAQVLSMDNTAAGLILLVGQIANGVGTTVVGVLLDRPTSLWVCVRVGELPIIIYLLHIYHINHSLNQH